MSQTQAEKQQAFREKLQTEGADSFADGPRPWEQWDESGNQHDNRVWEGTARRIQPKHKGSRGFGDRLLSGLAVVALASMIVGVAGIYFSTPSTLSTPQQARTKIQPPPIMASRTAMPPATRPVESADTAAPVLARLDTLPPPTAGTPAARVEHQTVLEPMVAAPRTAPIVQSDSIDKVAVETVITEETVTTTVYTRQLSQDEPELVAMVETTAPPFTHAAIQNDAPPVYTEPAAAGETAEVVTEPTVIAQAEIVATEPAVVEQATEVATEPTIVTQTETVDAKPAAVKETAEVVTEPTIVAQAEIVATEPAVVEQATEVATEPTIVTQAGNVETEPAAVEGTAEVATEPTIVAQAEIVETEPAAVEETVAAATEPTVVAEIETLDTEPVVVEETAKPETDATVVVLNTTTTAAAAAPDISRELETATEIPVLPKAKTGKWVINLSSYTRKPTAERMLAVFQRKGVVNAEVFTISINDKLMHRIRVTGFESARSAKAEISGLEQLLGLESAWVSKR